MPYSEKVHLRNCAIWFLIITVISVLISVFSYGKFDFIEYGKPNEYALGFIIEDFLVFLIYILPISIFRFCIRKKPVYTWIAAWLIAILYTALCSAVEVLVYDLLFELEMEPVGRFHGFFIPFLLHGGQYTPKPETVDVQPVSDQHELPADEQKEPSEYELQMRQEFNRYRQLRDERQKIPVDDVRQWHDEGKMTDDQYNKIISAYNSMGEEMEDIRKRVKLLNQTNAYQLPADENIPKKKKTKKNNKIPVVIAWCSSVLLFVCISLILLFWHEYSELTDSYDRLMVSKNDIASQYNASVEKYRKLQDNYNSLLVKYEYATKNQSVNFSDAYRTLYNNLKMKYNELEESYSDISSDLTYYKSLYYQNTQNKADIKIIKIGDTQQTVVEICGSPDKMVEQFKSWGTSDGWKWYYGTSYILFDDFYDTVEAWYIGDTPLPVE